MDEIDNNNTTKFNNILTELDLCQHIDQPTHIHGHTLDVLITQTECDLVSNIRVYDPCFVNDSGQSVQDHYLLECNIVGKKKTYKPRTILTRKWKYVNFENFQEDLEKLKDIPAYTSTDTNTLVELYNTELSKLADHHAPLRAVTLKRNLNPWYNNDIKKLKQERRQLERRWLRTKTFADKQLYKKKCFSLNKTLRVAKISHYKGLIEECGRDQKKTFSISNLLMGKVKTSKYPPAESKKHLADGFMQFFTNKVKRIHKELQEEQHKLTLRDTPSVSNRFPPSFQSFNNFSRKELKKYF